MGTGDDAGIPHGGKVDEHEADGTCPVDDDGITESDVKFVDAVDDAGEWFEQGSFGEAQMVGEYIGVTAHDAFGDDDVLGVGPIEELQVFAHALAVNATVVAGTTRSTIDGDDALTDVKTLYSLPNCGNRACEFVSKGTGERFEDAGMTTPIGFEVGAAGESSTDFDEEFAWARLRDRKILVAHIAWLVKYERFHSSSLVGPLGPPSILWRFTALHSLDANGTAFNNVHNGKTPHEEASSTKWGTQVDVPEAVPLEAPTAVEYTYYRLSAQ
jgi:hypothetical protein